MADAVKVLCVAIVGLSFIIATGIASDVGMARVKASVEIAKLKCEATP